jgi:hypothetical protein
MTLFARGSKAPEAGRYTPARTRGRPAVRWLSTVGCALGLLGVVAMPASAHVRVFLGFGLPPYPYPYAYAPVPAPPCYAPFLPFVAYGAPPAGWVRGHWAWGVGLGGRRVRVWVPPHLR